VGDSTERVAVVGAGSIGQRYIRLISDYFPKSKLMVVSNHLYSNASAIDSQYEVCKTIDSVLSAGVRRIIIANTANLHLQSIIRSINYNIAPFVEKPILASSKESKILDSAVANSKLYPLVGYNLRRYEGLIYLRDLIEAGFVVQPRTIKIRCHSYMPSWRPKRKFVETASARSELGGGVLLELSHEIDYAVWFFGRVSEVGCSLKSSLGLDVDTGAELVLKFLSGDEAHLSLKMDSRRECRDFRLIGEKITISLNLINMELQIDSENQSTLKKFPTSRDETFVKQLQEYFSNTLDPSTFADRYYDALHVMEIIEAARTSAKSGETIKIE
jgi:predicted dehydrogenase